MPAKSQAQRAYLNAKFGHNWVKAHHFDNKGKLPDHVIRRAIKARHKKKHGKPMMRTATPPSAPPSKPNMQAVKDMLMLRSAARTK